MRGIIPPGPSCGSSPSLHASSIVLYNDQVESTVPDERKRLVIIIGAHKCGTTSLFHYLAQHPQICPCSAKEPAFFAGPSPEMDLFERGWEWYRRLWPWKPGHEWGVEASPYYSMYQNAAKASTRMVERVPEWRFKIVYLLRNPVERIESEYRQGIPGGWIPGKYALRRTREIFPPSLQTSRYASHLREYARRFPREDIKIVLTERLQSDSSGFHREVLDFIGLDPSFQVDASTQHNATVTHYPGWLHGLVNDSPIRRLLPLYRTLPAWVKSPLRSLPGRRTRLTTAQREAAWRALRDDMAALRDEFGVDVGAWKPDR